MFSHAPIVASHCDLFETAAKNSSRTLSASVFVYPVFRFFTDSFTPVGPLASFTCWDTSSPNNFLNKSVYGKFAVCDIRVGSKKAASNLCCNAVK